MHLKILLLLMLAVACAHGQEDSAAHLEHLERHLSHAQKNFEIAKEMFDPYYTGPLLGPGASIPPPGHYVAQPYLFLKDVYGIYDDRGRGNTIPYIDVAVGSIVALAGVNTRLAFLGVAGYATNAQNGKRGSGWQDPSLVMLIPIVIETPELPGILISFGESFPLGKYQNLNPEKRGLDGIGLGGFQSSIFLNFGKLVWSIPTHPMRFRLSTQYLFPTHVRVHGFNSYGGGFGTNAKVRVPFSFAADFGYEFSFTKRWVFAFDILYTYHQKTTYKGFAGVTPECTPAVLGGPFGDNLSLAPAMEFNINKQSGVIIGPWFSVWGRNSPQFASAVFSYYILW